MQFVLGYGIAIYRDCEDPLGGTLDIKHEYFNRMCDDCSQFLGEHPEVASNPVAGEVFWLARNGRLEDLFWLARNGKIEIDNIQSLIETARRFGPFQVHIDLAKCEIAQVIL